ncbi:MAG: hypothetical protein AAGE94_13715 [Acidobacteriota bacterium]
MSETTRCHRYGYLVGAGHEIPTDARVHQRPDGPLVGCNQLVCRQCGARVKHWPGFRLQRLPVDRREREALYATTDPGASPFLMRRAAGHLFRTYACRCHCDEIVNPVDLDKGYLEFDGWTCGGHPT